MQDFKRLVLELCKLTDETSWVEFKHDNYRPDMIGEDIAALANSAALFDRDCAYMIWGVKNENHEVVGTKYNLRNIKKGNEELECYLRTLLSDNVEFEFYDLEIEEKKVGLLKIRRSLAQTAAYKKVEYVRVGSYTKKLADVPAVRAQLWDKLRNAGYEKMVCKNNLEVDEILKLLDVSKYFDLTEKMLPFRDEEKMRYLVEEEIIIKQDDGRYAITNLGALLLAYNLDFFPGVSRKIIRVVQYYGHDRMSDTKEYSKNAGYALIFDDMVSFLKRLTSGREVIVNGVRQVLETYPSIAIRESIGNALIHQDFSVSGAGPIIEIFDNRIEITNPGVPLVMVERIIDNPPKSRNEKIASLMRKMHLCEELGTGWDKIAISCEMMNLPAPMISVYENSTKVVLFAYTEYNNILYEDKLWACYLHACVRWVQEGHLTNGSLRERFGLGKTYQSSISRLIRDAVEKGRIKPFDSTSSPRRISYVPFWA